MSWLRWTGLGTWVCGVFFSCDRFVPNHFFLAGFLCVEVIIDIVDTVGWLVDVAND
ncbi:hypothetical protein P280DRAFT_320733 [Massarina eburnea CBS 473.64]|uniref:Uncharacterized protein n=1 Tax=Massarina eburnea CBS 473.64 TaxID=1395130 RepID=A0A6A6RZ72_9PLEO|nr:hypothetical protein P280DRAFT_320733 [Massarina eburnea CBS 473.64]